MCTYTGVLYLCGCCGPPICDTSCSQIMSELDRINHPEAWEGEGLTQLPFNMADECVPDWHNAILIGEATLCDHFLSGGCVPEQKVPEWIAFNVPWPEHTLEWLENSVEVPPADINVEWSGVNVEWSGDNAGWQEYDFPVLEYNPTLPEYDPGRPFHDRALE